jgi:hypothetical protein
VKAVVNVTDGELFQFLQPDICQYDSIVMNGTVVWHSSSLSWFAYYMCLLSAKCDVDGSNLE